MFIIYARTNTSLGQCSIEVPSVDSTWTKPTLRPVAAGNIHKFARYDVEKDRQKLMFLAHETLVANVAKIEKKNQQSADQSDTENESSDQDDDTTNNTSASSCEVVAVAPESSSKQNAFREAALKHYKKKYRDVYEMEMNHFLTDTEKLITGKPQYRLIKSQEHKEVGLLQIIKAKHPKQLKESDKAYHQMQALLYAGNSKYSYCHYVQCNLEKNIFVITIVKRNKRWEKKVVSNVKKYFEYYDAIWAKVQKECQDSSNKTTIVA